METTTVTFICWTRYMWRVTPGDKAERHSPRGQNLVFSFVLWVIPKCHWHYCKVKKKVFICISTIILMWWMVLFAGNAVVFVVCNTVLHILTWQSCPMSSDHMTVTTITQEQSGRIVILHRSPRITMMMMMMMMMILIISDIIDNDNDNNNDDDDDDNMI